MRPDAPARPDRRPPRRRAWLVALAAASIAGLAGGCAEERGPDPFVTTRIAGRVRAGSEPVEEGFVEFLPIDGAVGPTQAAPIGPDGRFVIERAAVGLNGVGILGVPLRRDQSALFDSLRTPIRRTIVAGSAEPLDIDLVEEVLLYQKAQKAAQGR